VSKAANACSICGRLRASAGIVAPLSVSKTDYAGARLVAIGMAAKTPGFSSSWQLIPEYDSYIHHFRDPVFESHRRSCALSTGFSHRGASA
jgi:hypothetical protein